MSRMGSRRRRRGRRDQRGFTLIMVLLLVVILALMGISILQLITLDLSLVGQSRRNFEARDIAEGGAFEIINHVNTNTELPSLDEPDLANDTASGTLPKPTTSPFVNASSGRDYDGEARFLRVIPLSESSHSWVRALVYELRTESNVMFQSSGELRVEAFRAATFEPGTILPRRHYR